jgi:tripartite-type tricarboxylate transporter receptor subunit TctC
VENKTGANALIATKEVKNANPDGYTLLFASLSHIVNPILLGPAADYDPIKDFTPVSLTATLPLIALTSADSKIASLSDLIARAKAAPGTISFGSAGNGGSGHLAGALLEMSAHVDMLHVPFRGNAPALTEVLAGRVSFLFYPTLGVAELEKEKRVRVLAVAAKQRLPQFPGVPTMTESGLDGFENTAIWLGALAPAKTPPAVIARLNAEMRKALAVPEVKARLAALGAIVVGDSAQEFASFLQQDHDRWQSVIKFAGIKAD